MRGFFLVWRRESKENHRGFDKSRKRFGPPPAPPKGGQDARCRRKMLLHFRHSAHPCALSRHESIPPVFSLVMRPAGLFYVWRRERSDENPTVRQTAKAALRDAGSGRRIALHCLHSAHPCALLRLESISPGLLNSHPSPRRPLTSKFSSSLKMVACYHHTFVIEVKSVVPICRCGR